MSKVQQPALPLDAIFGYAIFVYMIFAYQLGGLMRSFTISAAALMLASCATIEVPGAGSSGLPTPTTALRAETFSYRPAENRDLRVLVEGVVLKGEPDFLPTDPNWLQVRVRVENTGSRMLVIQSVRTRLADGTTLASASSIAEIMKPPSLAGSQLSTLGIGAGGMALGMLFPPAAIAGGAAIVLGPAITQDRMRKRAGLFMQRALRAKEPIEPGTSVVGDVWVPAVRGQTGFILFYEVGGLTHSLAVVREVQQ